MQVLRASDNSITLKGLYFISIELVAPPSSRAAESIDLPSFAVVGTGDALVMVGTIFSAFPFKPGRPMILLRRSAERLHVERGMQDCWLTFFPQMGPGPSIDEFGVLASLTETRLQPGGRAASCRTAEAEIVTYVHRGVLAQEDSTGHSGVVHAGEFQRMTSGSSIRHKETNASRTDAAHIFRLFLHPSEVGLVRAHEQRRFGVAERHNALCVVASPDGRKGSLHIVQDALIYSAVIDAGRHLIHELQSGRNAWLHLICGEATLQDIVMTPGDGMGLIAERVVSLTANGNAELLLVDVGPVPRQGGG